jgi:hypothetical protein
MASSKPLERVEGARPGTLDTVCSEEELRDIRQTVGWLKAAQQSFEWRNTPADAVYDTREARRHRPRLLSVHRHQLFETTACAGRLA